MKGAATAAAYVCPPPISGWNARDTEANMKEDEARVLDNWFPDTSELRVRRGYTGFCSSLGGSVETLMEYEIGTTHKLLSAANGEIFDITSGTASSLASGFSEDRWQTLCFGKHGFFMNGTDTMQDYDGSTVADATYTGPTLSNVVGGCVFKNRVWVFEKDTQEAWYSALGGVTGAMTVFALNEVQAFSGNIIAMNSVSTSGGTGPEDYLVIVFSTGQVVVYQGSDPGSDFQIVGVYNIAKPLGYRCMAKIGTDLVVITTQGYVPLTSVIKADLVNEAHIALSDKICGAAIDAARSYGSNSGWEVMFYPRGNMILVNVPVTATQSQQHVQNAMNKAWCRFKGINARTFCVFNDKLYFGGADGTVYLADYGNSDNGNPIEAVGWQAFTYLKAKAFKKRITAVKVSLRTNGNINVNVGMNMDFNTSSSTSTVSIGGDNLPRWGVARWGVDRWGGGTKTKAYTKTVNGVGYAASLGVTAYCNGQSLEWRDTLYLYEKGAAF